MNTDKMLNIINGIDEELIDQYFKISEEIKICKYKRTPISYIKWIVAAVCCAILICIPTVVHFLNPSQMVDSFRQGLEYVVKDIHELPAEYSGKLPVQNLKLSDNSKIEIYYDEDGSVTNAEDWFSLIVSNTVYSDGETVEIGDETVKKIEERLLVYCLFDGRTVEDEKVDMVFTKDGTQIVDINGVEVHIARNNNSLEFKYWYYAVFEYDGVVYDVRTKSDEPEYIYEVLSQMLE